MRSWADMLLALLLAPTCAACDDPLDAPTHGCVCPTCWRAITPFERPVCDSCGEPDIAAGCPCPHCSTSALHAGHGVDRARAVGHYHGALKAVVHALKYDGRRTLARPLAELMRAAGSDLLVQATVAVPVPLHRARVRERGFNQALDLARHLGLPVRPALERVKRTPSQTRLHAAGRAENVAGAFLVTPSGLELQGEIVLLVDDVRTTGATLDACAAALKGSGVRRVYALTAARVERSGR